MARKKVTEAYNLEKLFISLKPEWDEPKNLKAGLLMSEVSPFSDRKVAWACKDCGHEWEAQVKNRTKNGSGCPACAKIGKSVSAANSLANLFPEIAKTWHPTLNGELTPSQVRAKSTKIVYWQCADHLTHVFRQGIQKRTGYGKATCMICSGRLVTKDNALTQTHPQLIEEWDWLKNDVDPARLTAGSAKSVHWICRRFPEEHKWQSQIKNRTSKGSGCRYCNNQGSVPEIRLLTELETMFPDIEYRTKIGQTEVDLLLPSARMALEYDGSYWHRDKGEKDQNKNQVLQSVGVSVIRIRHKPLEKIDFYDVLVAEPVLTKKDVDRLLDAMYQKLGKTAPAVVKEYKEQPSFVAEERFQEKMGQLPGVHKKNNAAERAPHLLSIYSEKNALPLSSYSFGSGKVVIWECKKGHPDYRAPIKSKVKGNACPYCTKKLLAEENSLASKFPKIAEEWDLEKNAVGPDKVSYGSRRPYHWRCKRFDHSYRATVNNRTSGGGCPKCPKPGRSLSECAPELRPQWMAEKNGGLEFGEIPAGRKTKYFWRCALNAAHPPFKASPANMRRSAKTASKGCDLCRRAGKK